MGKVQMNQLLSVNRRLILVPIQRDSFFFLFNLKHFNKHQIHEKGYRK